jgi:hypothetical protein
MIPRIYPQPDVVLGEIFGVSLNCQSLNRIVGIVKAAGSGVMLGLAAFRNASLKSE